MFEKLKKKKKSGRDFSYRFCSSLKAAKSCASNHIIQSFQTQQKGTAIFILLAAPLPVSIKEQPEITHFSVG